MARPFRDPSGITTKERITAAATDLFEARGFDQVTVDDIANRAGVTQRTVFRYFASKAAIGLVPFLSVFLGVPPPAAGSRPAATATALDDLAGRIEERRAIVVRHTHILESSVALRTAARVIGDQALQTLRTDLARVLGDDEASSRLYVLAEIIYAIAYAARHRWVEDDDMPVADVLQESLRAAEGYLPALTEPA